MGKDKTDSLQVSRAVISRLPKYYRYLERLVEEGVERISSRELGDRVGVSAPQLRQDLNHFGNFGQQGYGYNVEKLCQALAKILGIETKSKMVLVGVGNLGQALVNSTDFEEHGFYLSAIFDINPRLIGLEVNGLKVKDMEKLKDYIKQNEIDIGIIAVPASAAQEIADVMTAAGVEGIWNFAPIDLELPPQIRVEEEHLTAGLLRLSFKISK